MRTKSAPQAPGPAAAFDEKELQPTREASGQTTPRLAGQEVTGPTEGGRPSPVVTGRGSPYRGPTCEEKRWPYVSEKDRDSFWEQWPAQCYGYKNREFEQEANTEKEAEPRRREKAEQEEPHGRGPDELNHFDDPQVEADHQEHVSEPEEDMPWPQEPDDDLAELESLEAEAEAAVQTKKDRQEEPATGKVPPSIEQIMKEFADAS